MAKTDPHSYFDSEQPLVERLNLRWNVNFEEQKIHGEVQLLLDSEASGILDLDTRDLSIGKVVNQAGKEIPYEWGEPDPVLGRRLRLDLPFGTREISIEYETSPECSALQWLTPEQTKGKQAPYLFSQCQQIHARSLVPLQDSPKVRVSYGARVTVPEGLTAVMSAGPLGTSPGPDPGTVTFSFEMPQPIPSYLLALSVGRLEARDLGPRSRIYAEPETVDAAAWEFAEIEGMMQTAEGIFGPYDWDRYDMLVLPPSFPYGGMENPRLTFLTPTLLAGDRSLVAVVAHELAHSWTGNLVTNASAEHFWLNEGFTVWAERRILEALYGTDYAAMAYAIGRVRLKNAINRFGADSPLTRLRTNLEGLNPDEVFSELPYEKGSRLVVLLERAAGRERFDEFVKDYMKTFRFTSITTEEFVEFLREKLPDVADEKVDLETWLYGTGLPENVPVFHSADLEEVQRLAAAWTGGTRPSPEAIAGWTPIDTQIFLQGLPRLLSTEECDWLDSSLNLTGQGNYEILCEWLTIAAGSDYEPAFDRIRRLLTEIGRMKFLRPIYQALGGHPRTRRLAREVFEEVKETYHALSRKIVKGILDEYPSEE